MRFSLSIENVQHVRSVSFEIDLSSHSLFCLVGRNGIGKTTLVKAIRNLKLADTFAKTSIDGIFNASSKITYVFGDHTYVFSFDERLQALNCHTPIEKNVKSCVEVELPMPFGERFNFFQNISSSDHEIRRNIVIENYTRPDELILFLSGIYGSDKFENLKQIDIKGRQYYCLILDNGRYVREDYLSSGEYFLISLYRRIRARSKLIVIDEIDISLDAAAQVHLLNWLRVFCREYQVNVLFTTHSLAMMQMLRAAELWYVESDNGHLAVECKSFNYVKSLLFGFAGWDRYILTEDEVLQNFLEFIIKKYIPRVFFKYKIIYVGGASNTVALMKRNVQHKFFGDPDNVCVVLDGDQRGQRYLRNFSDIKFLPWESIEKQVFVEYEKSAELPRVDPERNASIDNPDGKNLFDAIIRNKLLSEEQIFEFLCGKYEGVAQEFASQLQDFLID